jgi:hypothetical protein
VESCDFSTIHQLILAARKGAEQAGKRFAIAACAQAVTDSCTMSCSVPRLATQAETRWA